MLEYSVIIPAYDEEVLLADTIGSLRKGMDEMPEIEGEIIVVDNNSSDRTASVARSAGARVVFESINQISRARNAGGREAKGECFLFVDADTQVPPRLLAQALAAMKAEKVGAGGSTLHFDSDVPQGVSSAQLIERWNCISRTFRLAAGSFLFCLREAFESVGGFSEKVFAGEEIFLSIALKRWCWRNDRNFRILDEFPVVTSSRKLAWYSKRRLYAVILLPCLCPFLLRSKRFCRFWYERPESSSG